MIGFKIQIKDAVNTEIEFGKWKIFHADHVDFYTVVVRLRARDDHDPSLTHVMGVE